MKKQLFRLSKEAQLEDTFLHGLGQKALARPIPCLALRYVRVRSLGRNLADYTVC